jgi:hypothetical protein
MASPASTFLPTAGFLQITHGVLALAIFVLSVGAPLKKAGLT